MPQMGGGGALGLGVAWGVLIVVVLAGLALGLRGRRGPRLPRTDVLRLPGGRRLFRSRPTLFALRAGLVACLLLIVTTGLLGAPHAGNNFATVVTWTVWWTLIILVILLSGPAWCSVCPWQAIADWLRRGGLWRVGGPEATLGWRWPRSLSNRYPAVAFLLVITWMELGLFITYKPSATAMLAIGMVVAAIVFALLFRGHVFCRYVCFVGGIVGAYGNLAPVEIRSRGTGICRGCPGKECVHGSDKGYGCGLFLFPGTLSANTDCTGCTECLHTCPYDNMTVNLRPAGADLYERERGRPDETVLVLGLLGITLFHGFTMIPQWFQWGLVSYDAAFGRYMITSIGVMLAFVAVPLLVHAALVRLGRDWAGLKERRVRRQAGRVLAYAYLPVTLGYHLAHNLMHLNMEGLRLLAVLADPFGWGWQWLDPGALADDKALPMGTLQWLQLGVLVLGLFASAYLAGRMAQNVIDQRASALRAALPTVLGLLAAAAVGYWLLVQPMVMRTAVYF